MEVVIMLTVGILFFATIAPRISLGMNVKKTALQVALVLDMNMRNRMKQN